VFDQNPISENQVLTIFPQNMHKLVD